MRHILIIGILAAMTLTGQPGARVAVLSRSNHTMRAFSTDGERYLPLRRISLNATMPAGRVERAELYVFFDPAGGYFDWISVSGPRSDEPVPSAISTSSTSGGDLTDRWNSLSSYAGKDGMFLFEVLVAPPRLRIHESRERAQNLAEAEAKSLAAAAALDDLGIWQQRWRYLSISQLGLHFFIPKGSATYGPYRIVKVHRQDDGWQITVEAQWKENIFLNNKFELVGLTRVD